MIDVIYLAAGVGKRARLGYPKQFARLGGKPIMVHGFETLLKLVHRINKIIVTYPIDTEVNTVESIINVYSACVRRDKIVYVMGGATRQQSVYNALAHVETDKVLITEAVRPFITTELIERVLDQPGSVVTPMRPAVSTLVTQQGAFINREEAGEVQMPQRFPTEVLRGAHAYALSGSIEATDDASLVWCTLGWPVHVIAGIEENIKITTPLDLIIAEAIYDARHRDRE